MIRYLIICVLLCGCATYDARYERCIRKHCYVYEDEERDARTDICENEQAKRFDKCMGIKL